MELRTITCPNCGATTTNHHNCEYCGSLLVRLISKELTIEDDIFGEHAYIIPGLEKALEENLYLQEALTPDQTIVTTIEDSNNPDDAFQILPALDVSLGTNRTSPFQNSEIPSIALRLSFLINSINEEQAHIARDAYQNFKELSISQLFVEQQWQYGIDYYINFGKDILNAAHICSKLAESIAFWDEDSSIICYSNIVKKQQLTLVNKEEQWSNSGIIWASIGVITLGIIIFIMLIGL